MYNVHILNTVTFKHDVTCGQIAAMTSTLSDPQHIDSNSKAMITGCETCDSSCSSNRH